MNHFFNALVPIALFASIFGIIYVFLTTRHKERKALIEKGADANLFYSEKKGFNWSWSKFTLKIGIFFMGLTFGLFLAALLSNLKFINDAALYFSSIFFFGGLSLLLYYIFMDRKSK